MAPKFWKFIAFLTPTYLLYRLLKKYCRNTDAYTLSERFDGVFLILAFLAIATRYAWEKSGTPYGPLFLGLAVIQTSRCVEIPTAFLADALETLRTRADEEGHMGDEQDNAGKDRKVRPQSDGGSPTTKGKVPRYRRIKLAISVYFELVLNYALLYALMPGSYWSAGRCPTPSDLAAMGVMTASGSLSTISALYYSVATMTTLGYGDIVGLGDLPRFCSMVQVLSSIILVVMSIAIYAALGTDQTNQQQSPDR